MSTKLPGVKLPDAVQAVIDHLHPELSTDGSRDIENATATHGATLDAEAAEGMTPPLAPYVPEPVEVPVPVPEREEPVGDLDALTPLQIVNLLHPSVP